MSTFKCLPRLFLSGFLVASTLFASAAAQTPPPPPPILLGTAWYPEQWPESRWDADLALMEQAHIRMVRVGEFAWSRMEPSEGHYDLDWLDRAIVGRGQARHLYACWARRRRAPRLADAKISRDAAHRRRWTAAPSTAIVQQFDFANAKYRESGTQDRRATWPSASDTIPYVIGWQIDNEYASRIVRPDDQGAISAVAEGALRHARQSECALDHYLLEPDLLRLEPDSDRRRSMAIPGCC